MKKGLSKFREWKVTLSYQGRKGQLIQFVLIYASYSYEVIDPIPTDVAFQVSAFYPSFLESTSIQKTITK